LISVVDSSDQDVKGGVAAGFEPLGEAFSQALAASHGHGGALHVRLDGKVVADLWGGNAVHDGDAPRRGGSRSGTRRRRPRSETKGVSPRSSSDQRRAIRHDGDAPRRGGSRSGTRRRRPRSETKGVSPRSSSDQRRAIRHDGDQRWQNDTPSVIFSCTKGLVSILVGELVREGRLDLDAPVSAYWPEFDRHDKGSMPVRWLLSHRAGLPAVRQSLELADVVDWERMVGLLAEERPLLPPGEIHQYHAVTFGWLAGEVIRRITGKGVAEFFVERIVKPLGVAAWIGMPEAELPRVAQLYSTAPPAEALPLRPGTDPELATINEKAMTLGAAFSVDFVEGNNSFNNDEVRRAVIPGAGGIATAPALATIWSATVSNAETIRLLNDEVIADMSREQSSGKPAVPLPGPWARWGSGFMLSSEARPFLSDASFGHDGAGGQVSFADPEYKVGFAYLTNDLQFAGDTRGVLLVEVLRDLLGVRG
jgi:CubicO group peptidase (beta-lactamase class C family)